MIPEDMDPTDCAECGHPESHHDAGECWTDASGLECSGGSVCGCGWYEPIACAATERGQG